jgi:GrpB-like predicted nucleotidyltransferase (UPF0157 family)
MAKERLDQRVQRVLCENIAIEPYDPSWPVRFQLEKEHLVRCLPNELIERIEHFGSTAVPGLSAKPIIDMLVGVTSLAATRARIVPVLEGQGYEYFWRPTFSDDQPPWYAWFIKRDPSTGGRSHHLHMVESTPPFAEHWDRLLFRDYLIEHPRAASEYDELKRRLARRYAEDRVRYTRGKTEFIQRVTALARISHKSQ